MGNSPLGMWLLQANSGKVQSFSKFQAELRAQHKHSKGRHKHKRDRQQQQERHDTPKGSLQTSGSHADTAQVSCNCGAVFPHLTSFVKIRACPVYAYCTRIVEVHGTQRNRKQSL